MLVGIFSSLKEPLKKESTACFIVLRTDICPKAKELNYIKNKTRGWGDGSVDKVYPV